MKHIVSFFQFQCDVTAVFHHECDIAALVETLNPYSVTPKREKKAFLLTISRKIIEIHPEWLTYMACQTQGQ